MFVGSGKVQMGVACDSMKQCIMILDKPYIGVFIRGNLCISVENIKHRLHFCQNIIYNQKCTGLYCFVATSEPWNSIRTDCKIK